MAFRTDAPANDSGLYTEGNPSLGIPATVVSADAMNFLQEELVTLVEFAGITLNKVDNTQVRKAIQAIAGSGTIDTTGYLRLTDSAATALDTLFSEIDALFVSGNPEKQDYVDVGTPASPAAGKLRIYQVGDVLFQKTDAGAIKQLTNTGVSGIPDRAFNNQVGISYTLVLTDSVTNANKLVTMNNAADSTLTVPPNASAAFPIGSQIDVLRLGAGRVGIAEGAGVTINAPSGLLFILEQNSFVSLIKTATDTWQLFHDVGPGFISAIGGDSILTVGDFKIHIFLTSGDFESTGTGDLEYLMFGGGGGAGQSGGLGTGGGGGGGRQADTFLNLSPGVRAVVIGAGGAKGSTSDGTNGNDTTFNGVIALGGGAGAATGNGLSGGSGGGDGSKDLTPGGAGTAGQGFAGGGGATDNSTFDNGGGGGGASEVGDDAVQDNSGDGGDGLSSSITGTPETRGGGGGGGAFSGSGGAGGAGGGGSSNVNGTVNTGGGGGGGGSAGNGGSGYAAFKYKFQ